MGERLYSGVQNTLCRKPERKGRSKGGHRGNRKKYTRIANYGSLWYNIGVPMVTGAAKPKSVIAYADANGSEPFTDWLYGLRDIMGRKRILARVARLEQGN